MGEMCERRCELSEIKGCGKGDPAQGATGCDVLFAQTYGELRASLSNGTLVGMYGVRQLDTLNAAHNRLMDEWAEGSAVLSSALRNQRNALDHMRPLDRKGVSLECGDVVDLLGEVCTVAGVDDCGGIFLCGDDTPEGYFEYVDASLAQRIDLGPVEPLTDEATSLAEIVERMEDCLTDPDAHGNGDEMAALVERLGRIARAALG